MPEAHFLIKCAFVPTFFPTVTLYFFYENLFCSTLHLEQQLSEHSWISSWTPNYQECFDWTSFLRLGQKSLEKFRWFLIDLKSPKKHFKINWRLTNNNKATSEIILPLCEIKSIVSDICMCRLGKYAIWLAILMSCFR